jgi:hypothetical protein
MPSNSLLIWVDHRAKTLDEIEAAHHAVGGSGRGRRYATQQLNQAYTVMLMSQFQGFCRDLHSEAVDNLVAAVQPSSVSSVLRGVLIENRALDRGNANAGSLGADFGRLGLSFWKEVNATDARVAKWQARLDVLNDWRNAIAHQSFGKVTADGSRAVVFLYEVQAWRRMCGALARAFDRVVGAHIGSMLGSPPW